MRPTARGSVSFPTPKTAGNCCFGGSDGTRLFIAAETHLFAVDLTESAV